MTFFLKALPEEVRQDNSVVVGHYTYKHPLLLSLLELYQTKAAR